MKLLRTNQDGTRDLTQLCSRCTWAGDAASCCRTLDVELACIPGADLPAAEIGLGDHISFFADQQLFDGFVLSVQTATNDRTRTVHCFDRGIYLKSSQGYYRFQDVTPEAVVRRLGTDFDFALGDVAVTSHRFSRNFLGQSLYKIIATGYTLASASTGDKYQIGFELDRLTVRKKQQDQNTLVLRGGSNLLSASVTESIENLISRVQVVDDRYNLVSTSENADWIRRYGVMQSVLRQSDNSADEARKLLEDHGPAQTITVENLGDARCITGRMVAIQEPYTGLYGLFWIDADTHVWADGIYTNKLTLNFKNVMDEQEAGAL